MKKKINVIANEESFHNLSSFKDVEELNQTVRTYRDTIRMSIKRTDVQAKLLRLLELLKRHSCKYVGVSFLCKNSIAEKMKVSYKTVQRLMKKLVDLKMINQVAMKRTKDMLQTSNAIIIQPIVEEVSDKVGIKSPPKCPTIKIKPVSLKQNIKDINKRNSNENSNTPEENIEQVDFVAHWVPERFVSLVSSFYSESKTIQELWKVVRQCNKVTNFSTGDKAFDQDQELTIGLKAIKEFVMKIKSGTKMKKGKFAYFNGIVNNLMDKFYFDDTFII
ncbi:helix-turn-helix domain-containing protein [Bacillus cereus]|uniref:Helix-turn-helix domain-containing protein n=1 Tax=Bacillus cereus TaxID=1396 RepID=A0AAW5L0Z9_BACCE|nr:helix-turn-helix domain-containing protein [Bacillus cereus]MCQ6285659.1 helix-turn-helix domain-containing protein [Bacillus cereus]MCQ6303375.1 helix-turn-helix domain-containing protein [Bacillus cereus]MCQ6314518.1 helix-turn-helix domain-containing protein [Bacillus cereus]MCQ6327644.1 helix-turn-helix domain-containing protein [Bacillus cereus]MCQ6382506.1 helix-turn-helix domain-containing protein [Bacillus cereus]